MKSPKEQILSRLKGGRRRSGGRKNIGSGAAEPSNEAFSFEIPGAEPGKPLWRLALEMSTVPEGEGERLKLRLHWQANLGSVAALPAPAASTPQGGGGTQLAQRVGRWTRKGLAQPLIRRLAQPLLRHDFNSWLEIQASTADLARGSATLLSESDKLKAIGVEVPAGDQPLARSWITSAPGAQPGFAQLSLMRLDKRHLPPALAALLGAKPFQMAAAMVNVVEEKPRS